MKLHRHFVAVALVMGLAACASQYTESEASKQLTLDDARARIDLRFASNSSQLFAGDVAKLRRLAASGDIAPSDRVTVWTGGPPALAAARFETVATILLPYRVVAAQGPLTPIGPNRAIVSAERYLVTLPKCPAWSQKGSLDFTNASPSNFGCAIAVDLGLSIARPADLAEGTPVGMPDGRTAASAVNRYLNDKVTLPIEANVSPITAAPAALPTGGENLATSPE